MCSLEVSTVPLAPGAFSPSPGPEALRAPWVSSGPSHGGDGGSSPARKSTQVASHPPPPGCWDLRREIFGSPSPHPHHLTSFLAIKF